MNLAFKPGAAVTATGLDRYTPERPLVLLTEYAPDATGGGGVILRGLLGPEERSRVVWLTLTPFDPAAAEGWAGMALLGRGSAGRTPGAGRSLWLDSTVYSRPIADEVRGEAQARRARALWVVLHGAIVPAAARLTRHGDLPVHATVHDDPVGHAAMSRRYRALTPWVARAFAASLRRARSVDTICGPMADRYRSRYGVASEVVHRGVDGPVGPSPAYDRSRGLTVGVIGSIYEYSMLLALGRAVGLAAGRSGVAGKVVLVGDGVGDHLASDLSGVVEVEVTGHLPEPEAARRLSGCFVLYANYPFERRFALFRQTSFPTKVSTYALAARPLLIHSPADGSVVALTTRPDRYAAHWGSPRAADGAEVLRGLWDDPALHRSVHEAAESVRSHYYDASKNRAALFRLLNALVPAGA